MENIYILLAVSLGLQAYTIYQQKKGFKDMGDRFDAKLAQIEADVQALGVSIQTEIQQLKDAIAGGVDVDAALARLDAIGGNILDSNYRLILMTQEQRQAPVKSPKPRSAM